MDGDGKDDFVANLLFKTSRPDRFGSAIYILTRNANGFEVRASTEPLIYADTSRDISLADLNGHGLMGVLDVTGIEAYGDVPPYDLVVYINDRTRGLREIFSKECDITPQVKDLDGDKRSEILLPTFLGRKDIFETADVLWTDIYQWNGNSLVKSNCKYAKFYAQKRRDYEAALIKYQAITDPEQRVNVSVLRDYLARFDKLTKCG